ncbi:MAG: transketolase family protein [bacterium]
MRKWSTVNNIYERVLLDVGRERQDLVVIDADLARATQTKLFKENFPERYFDVGVAEQNMACIAAGFALSGRPVIISTFSVFLTKRACDQVSISIAYPELNVKLMGVEAGLSSGRNGATHQAVEDLAIMRAMPNMVVMDPLDAVEIRKAVKAAVDYRGPVYMRMRRGQVPIIFGDDYEFQWGKGVTMREGRDVAIISTGIMTEEALKASDLLCEEGIEAEVLHLHTLKPLDEGAIIRTAEKTGAVVTAENHSIIGGLGGAVAEVLGENLPTPIRRIGIRDLFGETGTNEYLFRKYRLTAEDIASAAKEVLKQKCKGS